MTEKDFQKWHKIKKILDVIPQRVFFHEREVWWCSTGANIGFEQDGRGDRFARPVLVFKKFNNEIFWAIPLSTKIKKNKFYAEIILGDRIPRVVIISQLRLIDAKRLLYKVGTISDDNYAAIQKAVMYLCDT